MSNPPNEKDENQPDINQPQWILSTPATSGPSRSQPDTPQRREYRPMPRRRSSSISMESHTDSDPSPRGAWSDKSSRTSPIPRSRTVSFRSPPRPASTSFETPNRPALLRTTTSANLHQWYRSVDPQTTDGQPDHTPSITSPSGRIFFTPMRPESNSVTVAQPTPVSLRNWHSISFFANDPINLHRRHQPSPRPPSPEGFDSETDSDEDQRMPIQTADQDISPLRIGEDSMDLDVIMENTDLVRPSSRRPIDGQVQVMLNSINAEHRALTRSGVIQSEIDVNNDDSHDIAEGQVAECSTRAHRPRPSERNTTVPNTGPLETHGGRLAVAETRTGRKRELSGGSSTRRGHSPHGRERDEKHKKRKVKDKGKGKACLSISRR